MNALAQGAAVGATGMVSLTAGGIWSAIHHPSNRTRAIVRHLAAGTVFAGLVSDVLERLLKSAHYWWMGFGMVLGLSLMTFIRAREERTKGGAALAPFIVVDVLIDGVLMGLSVASGSPFTVLFVIALMPELGLLGMTLSDELGGSEWGALKRIIAPGFVGIGVVAGGILGAWSRSGPDALAITIEGFGAIALAYLVTEALLREAHGQAEQPWIAAMFFAGFIPLFLAAAATAGSKTIFNFIGRCATTSISCI